MARRGAPRAGRLMPLLDEILAQKAKEVLALHAAPPSPRPAHLPVRDVLGALRRPAGSALRLVAEIKFRSPSAGPLSRGLAAADRGRAYARAGAAMISVLTDERWFDGSFADLAAVRAAVDVPVLCKDYVIDEAQVARAWSAGADAVLVIVRCLKDAKRVRAITDAVRGHGLEPFVEVVDEDELALALDAGARLIGVNARDLDTLAMDADRAARVLARVPAPVVAVHLSGLKSVADASKIATSRADAALIGEALMRREDPEPHLRDLVRAAAGA
jgi:indole-3-glycerol phosphate synthase